MRSLTAALALTSSLLTGAIIPAARAADAEPSPIELFNGRNLDGLHVFIDQNSVSVDEAWKIEDGMLRCQGVGRGYVRSVMPYADYKLRLEWRWPKGRGNSGVLVHVVNRDAIWPKGFELQLATDRAGDIVSFYDARAADEVVSRNPRGVSTGRLPRRGDSQEKPLGEWNTYEIVAEGDTLTVSVNGVQVNRMTGLIPSAGFVAFQSEGAAIDFRNITLTPLPPQKDMNAPMPAP